MTAPPNIGVRPLCATEHCRHYSYEHGGIRDPNRGPKCACGIDLSGSGAALACMPNPDPAKAHCPQREEYTDVERGRWKTWVANDLNASIPILERIPSPKNARDRSLHGKSGSFPCPKCNKGIVRWSRAPNNGHLHAGCSTPGCFGIIQ